MPWGRIAVIVVILLNLGLLVRLVWSGQGVFAYLELKARHEMLQQRLDHAEERARELSAEIRRLKNDPEAQEEAVRERMHFVADDEILYIFPGADDEPSAEVPDGEQD